MGAQPVERPGQRLKRKTRTKVVNAVRGFPMGSTLHVRDVRYRLVSPRMAAQARPSPRVPSGSRVRTHNALAAVVTFRVATDLGLCSIAAAVPASS